MQHTCLQLQSHTLLFFWPLSRQCYSIEFINSTAFIHFYGNANEIIDVRYIHSQLFRNCGKCNSNLHVKCHNVFFSFTQLLCNFSSIDPSGNRNSGSVMKDSQYRTDKISISFVAIEKIRGQCFSFVFFKL